MNTDTAKRNRFVFRAVGLASAALLPALLAGCEDLSGPPRPGGAWHNCLLHGYDVMCYPGQNIPLVARLEPGNRWASVRGAEIVFTCDQVEIGRACTDFEGYARIRWTVPGEPGCRFIGCRPAWPDIAAEVANTRLLVAALPPDTPLLVVDMDSIIACRAEAGVVNGAADGARCAQQACGCRIVYLGDPADAPGIRCRDWLDDNGFPLGPLLLCRRPQPCERLQCKCREQTLRELKSRFRNIRVGVGAGLDDVQSYWAADVPLSILVRQTACDNGHDADRCALAARKRCVLVAEDWRDVERAIVAVSAPAN